MLVERQTIALAVIGGMAIHFMQPLWSTRLGEKGQAKNLGPQFEHKVSPHHNLLEPPRVSELPDIKDRGVKVSPHHNPLEPPRVSDKRDVVINDENHVVVNDIQDKATNENKLVVGQASENEQVSNEAIWKPTFEALGKDHYGKVPINAYISFQAGSFGPKVQEKFRELAKEFASEDKLDFDGFIQLKASEKKHEKVLALSMFQSFDHDSDGQITVDDLFQWTKKDAMQHYVELDNQQEKDFLHQYERHADANSKLNFDAFMQTGLTKLVINSHLEGLAMDE